MATNYIHLISAISSCVQLYKNNGTEKDDIGIGKSLKQDLFANNKKSPKIQIRETATKKMIHLNKNSDTGLKR